MMKQKDFEGLAKVLHLGLTGKIDIARGVAEFCGAQNPRFDIEKFLDMVAGKVAIPAPMFPPTVYVHVEGGAVSISKPKGVAVEVVDFDADGADSAELCGGHNCEVHRDHFHEVHNSADRVEEI